MVVAGGCWLGGRRIRLVRGQRYVVPEAFQAFDQMTPQTVRVETVEEVRS